MVIECFEDIVDMFEFLDDWEDCYCYVIEFGKVMLELDEVFKVFVIKVQGCVSQVWLVLQVNDGVFWFDGDSDVLIVCGFVVILQVLYNDLFVVEVLKVDVYVEMVCLGLNDYLLV